MEMKFDLNVHVENIFLQIHLFGEIIEELLIYIVTIINSNIIGICNSTIQTTVKEITHKPTLELTKKIGLNLFCVYLLNYIPKINFMPGS